MARRRYQKGCLFKRGKNWVLRYREDVRNSNGSIGRVHRAVVLGSFATKKEAHQAADSYLLQFNNGSRLPQTILTFEEFWTKHFQLEILTKRKFSTQQVYRYLVGKHLLPFFGRQRMCDISRLDVQSFVSHKQRQRYAPKTLMHLRNLLSKIFGVAISWGWLNGNPATGVELPPREKRREARVLALGEIARLSQAFGEPVKTIFLLGLLTGLRIGEILGIRIGDVDVTGRLLYVRRDVYRGHVQDVPKTKQSERGVPLAAILVVAIQQWLGMRPSGSEWLFPVTPELHTMIETCSAGKCGQSVTNSISHVLVGTRFVTRPRPTVGTTEFRCQFSNPS